MKHLRDTKSILFLLSLAALLSACATPEKPTPEYLDTIGVKNGASAFDVQRKLGQEGFECNVYGTKRENFDCSKTKSAYLGMSSCVLRLEFKAGDDNKVENLRVPDMVCAGF